MVRVEQIPRCNGVLCMRPPVWIIDAIHPRSQLGGEVQYIARNGGLRGVANKRDADTSARCSLRRLQVT